MISVRCMTLAREHLPKYWGGVGGCRIRPSVVRQGVSRAARARPNGTPEGANLCATASSTVAVHRPPGHWKKMTVVPVEPRVPVTHARCSGRHCAGTWGVDLRVGLGAAIFTPFGTPIHHALGLVIARRRPSVYLTHLIRRNWESVLGCLASGGQITHFGSCPSSVIDRPVAVLVKSVRKRRCCS